MKMRGRFLTWHYSIGFLNRQDTFLNRSTNYLTITKKHHKLTVTDLPDSIRRKRRYSAKLRTFMMYNRGENNQDWINVCPIHLRMRSTFCLRKNDASAIAKK